MMFLFSFSFNQKFSRRSNFLKLLFETQPACVSKMLLDFSLISASCFL